MAYRPSRTLALLAWLAAIGLVVLVVVAFGDDLLFRIPLG